MKHLKFYSTLAIIFFGINITWGQSLSKKEKEIIHTEAIDLIKNYETTLNNIALNMGTDEAAVTGLKDEFISLFLNRQIQIYNDLEPSHLYSEFYEVETYITNLVLWYPDGMRINFDYSQTQSPGIKLHKDNIWFLDVHATKRISGNYMNRQINENKEDLSFRIAFVKNKKKVSNFKIVGIRNVHSTNLITDENALKELNKAEYTTEEEVTIHQTAKSLLLDYIRALELIGNPDEKDENKEFYTYDFLSLFESEEARVLNDIEPVKEESLIDLKSYIENYKTNYPSGITNLALNLDSANFSHIEKTEDGRFQTFVYVEKFFSGNFEDKQKFSQAVPLIFTLSFERNDGVFQNVLIKSIDKEYTDFSGINAIDTDAETQLNPMTPITRVGNSIGFSYMGGRSNINSQNLNELDGKTNFHEWKTEPQYGYSVGIDFLMFKNNNWGFVSGLKYSEFKTSYILSGEYVNNEQVDVNPGHTYVDSIQANLDSTLTLNYISVPISFRYCQDLSRNISYYVNAGLNISFLYKSQYELSGNVRKHVYYTDEAHAGNGYEAPHWLDYNYNYSSPKSGRSDVKTINIIGELTFGLNIRTGYYSSIQFGPKLLYGLTSITKGDSYTDIFGNSHESKPTRTNMLGFEFSYIRKL